MRKFCVYINDKSSTQRVLVEEKGNNKFDVILFGDLHYDRFCERVDGFYEALNYLGIEYQKERKFTSFDDNESLRKLWEIVKEEK